MVKITIFFFFFFTELRSDWIFESSLISIITITMSIIPTLKIILKDNTKWSRSVCPTQESATGQLLFFFNDVAIIRKYIFTMCTCVFVDVLGVYSCHMTYLIILGTQMITITHPHRENWFLLLYSC